MLVQTYIKQMEENATNPLALISKQDALKSLGAVKGPFTTTNTHKRRKKNGKSHDGHGGKEVAMDPESDPWPEPRVLEEVPIQDALTNKMALENAGMKLDFIVVKVRAAGPEMAC